MQIYGFSRNLFFGPENRQFIKPEKPALNFKLIGVVPELSLGRLIAV
jgi:hypothetical protein